MYDVNWQALEFIDKYMDARIRIRIIFILAMVAVAGAIVAGIIRALTIARNGKRVIRNGEVITASRLASTMCIVISLIPLAAYIYSVITGYLLEDRADVARYIISLYLEINESDKLLTRFEISNIIETVALIGIFWVGYVYMLPMKYKQAIISYGIVLGLYIVDFFVLYNSLNSIKENIYMRYYITKMEVAFYIYLGNIIIILALAVVGGIITSKSKKVNIVESNSEEKEDKEEVHWYY